MLLEELYGRFGTMVYNLALNYVQNVEDAEEITQDVFLAVFDNLTTFQAQSSHKTWIYRITINKSLDFIKYKNSKKRGFVFGTKIDSEAVFPRISDFNHPGVILENEESLKQLFAFINALPENQKTALLLSKLDGLSNPEIAAVMETTVSAIESLLFRAKATLKQKIENK
jgi:RNA polymerase sigma-70 factor (ECF subfamily)